MQFVAPTAVSPLIRRRWFKSPIRLAASVQTNHPSTFSTGDLISLHPEFQQASLEARLVLWRNLMSA